MCIKGKKNNNNNNNKTLIMRNYINIVLCTIAGDDYSNDNTTLYLSRYVGTSNILEVNNNRQFVGCVLTLKSGAINPY